MTGSFCVFIFSLRFPRHPRAFPKGKRSAEKNTLLFSLSSGILRQLLRPFHVDISSLTYAYTSIFNIAEKLCSFIKLQYSIRNFFCALSFHF